MKSKVQRQRIFMRIRLFLVICLGILCTGPVEGHDSRNTMTFQGRLTDAAGVPLTGNHTFILRYYTSESAPVGTEVFFDRHVNTPVSAGVYDLTLGTGLDAGGVSFNDGIPDSVFDNTELWIGLQVEPDGSEMTPRTRISSSPFAFRAVEADMIGGLLPGQLTRSDVDSTITGNVTFTGEIIGVNVTTGTDPGHKHTSADVTESQDLQQVTDLGDSTTNSIRIGSAGVPTDRLDVDGNADISGNLNVTGFVTGTNVTSGNDPGHTHTGGFVFESDTLDDVTSRPSGDRTVNPIRIGSAAGPPTDTLDVDGSMDVSGNVTIGGDLFTGSDDALDVTGHVTVSGTLTAVGEISGPNVTSGTDPGHKHTGADITEIQDLQGVTDLGNSTTQSIRIGSAGVPSDALDVDGNAHFSGSITATSNITTSQFIFGKNVTTGADPGHTHTAAFLTEGDTLATVTGRGSSTTEKVRIGANGTTTENLQVDGTALITSNVTVSGNANFGGSIDVLGAAGVGGALIVGAGVDVTGDVDATGTVTGTNVTSGNDPGHTHGPTSITEDDDLQIVTDLGNSTTQSIRVGSSGTPTDTLDVDGTMDVSGNVTVGGDLFTGGDGVMTITGNVTTTGDLTSLGNLLSSGTIIGGNVTSGSDPGHTHTAGSLTEAQDLMAVTTQGNTTTLAIRIGGATAPTRQLNVDGDTEIDGLLVLTGNVSTTGSILGVNVTSGADPGHTHTAGALTEGDTLQTVTDDGNSTTRSVRIGTTGTPAETLHVDGTALITSNVTVSGNAVVAGSLGVGAGINVTGSVIATGAVTGTNVTSGADPGHTHSVASITEDQNLDEVLTEGNATTRSMRLGNADAGPTDTLDVDGTANFSQSVTVTANLEVTGNIVGPNVTSGTDPGHVHTQRRIGLAALAGAGPTQVSGVAFADIGGSNLLLTTTGGSSVIMMATVSATNITAGENAISYTFGIDAGTVSADALCTVNVTGTQTASGSFHFMATPTNGPHTYTVRARRDGTSNWNVIHNRFVFTVFELR